MTPVGPTRVEGVTSSGVVDRTPAAGTYLRAADIRAARGRDSAQDRSAGGSSTNLACEAHATNHRSAPPTARLWHWGRPAPAKESRCAREALCGRIRAAGQGRRGAPRFASSSVPADRAAVETAHGRQQARDERDVVTRDVASRKGRVPWARCTRPSREYRCVQWAEAPELGQAGDGGLVQAGSAYVDAVQCCAPFHRW